MTQNTLSFGPATVRPPYDPELASVLGALRDAVPSVNEETLSFVRQIMQGDLPGQEPVDLTVGGKVQVEELIVATDDGELQIVVLSPAEGEGPWPLIYNIHGGGMVAGSRHLALGDLTMFVAEGSAVMTSIEYRLAPEHPDPIPVTDCYDGLRWCADNATRLRIDPSHIIVNGTSAGGCLAAGITLMARDKGFPTSPTRSSSVLCSTTASKPTVPPCSTMTDSGIATAASSAGQPCSENVAAPKMSPRMLLPREQKTSRGSPEPSSMSDQLRDSATKSSATQAISAEQASASTSTCGVADSTGSTP
ncbi:alpha/beta hydrolase domain-containing protein [Nocardia nova SH22a]|uniref:Alpha/beta hydrolase domain-containing protein n=1 Tax=Nocardia nova SH22a TaxID=1415166 RepID=W5TLN1_9NOCA|nr:alpha/beta hydrolase domain-containing protein [Nocardia nova SH22a]